MPKQEAFPWPAAPFPLPACRRCSGEKPLPTIAPLPSAMQALSLSALQLPCRSRGWSRARGSRRPSQLHLPAPPLPLAPLRSFAQPSHPLRSPVASLGQPLSDLAEAAAVVKPTWGLLGALVCLAGYGLFTALRVAAERAREEELQARARARHQQYLDSIGDKNQSLPSKGVETAGEEGFACTSHSGGSRFSSTGASTSVASAPGPGMGVFSGRVYERSPMVTCFAFDSSEAVTTDEASFVAPSSNGRDPLEVPPPPPHVALGQVLLRASLCPIQDSPSSLPLNRSAKQPSAKVTLYYRSGWQDTPLLSSHLHGTAVMTATSQPPPVPLLRDQAVLHGSVAGGEWAGYGTSKVCQIL